MNLRYSSHFDLGLNLSINNMSSINSFKHCFIVLGHEIDPESFELSFSSKARCNKLYEKIVCLNKNSYFIIFMGQGRLQGNCNNTIAECMFKYFSNKFFLPKSFILDKSSLDSVGDAIFSLNILEFIKYTTNNTVNLITSDWHMDRVKLIFQEVFQNKYNLSFHKTSELNNFCKQTLINITNKEISSKSKFIQFFKDYDYSSDNLLAYLRMHHPLYKE